MSKIKHFTKYDKDLKRNIPAATSIPSEQNQLRNEGFKETTPKASAPAKPAADTKTKN